MLGKIEGIKYIILGVAAVATFTDLFFGKIYNWITLPTALCGGLVSSYYLGWFGFGQAGLGISLGMLLYGGLFGLRVMGGGDVKLLMALGAWGGPVYTAEVAILGVLVGGVFAVILLAVTGRLVGFVVRCYHFLLTLFVKELEVEMPKVDKTFTMAFGVPLSVAAVWVAFSNPFFYIESLMVLRSAGESLWGRL